MVRRCFLRGVTHLSRSLHNVQWMRVCVCVCVCMNAQPGTETDGHAKKGKQEHGHVCQVVTLVLMSRSVF